MVAALALCAGTAMAQNVTTAPAPTFPERHPNQTTTLHAISFADDFNIPIWIAQRQGFFAAEKLDVKLDFTPGSTWQITHLLAGNYDIAYRKGQNEAYIPPEVKVDLTSVLNSDNAFLSVSAQGNVKQFADLRGRTVTVDAMTTGFAFVLREVLAGQGVPGRCQFRTRRWRIEPLSCHDHQPEPCLHHTDDAIREACSMNFAGDTYSGVIHRLIRKSLTICLRTPGDALHEVWRL